VSARETVSTQLIVLSLTAATLFGLQSAGADEPGWRPEGANQEPVPALCSGVRLRELLISMSSSPNAETALNNWKSRCETSLNKPVYGRLRVMFDMDAISYTAAEQPASQALSFRLRDQRVIRGVLALKRAPGGQILRRPLVLARCGVFCDAGEGPLSAMAMMHLFDEGPFHLLILGSNSGRKFAQDNHSISLNGLDEGRQMVEVLEQLLAQPRYQSLFSDVHFFGTSLGGLGTLFAAVFVNEASELARASFRSTIAMCPVTDLKRQLEAAFQPTLEGLYYTQATRNLVRDVLEFVPTLLIQARGGLGLWNQRQIRDLVETESARASGGTNSFSSTKDFLEANRFLHQAGRLATPTLVVSSRDDEFVPSDINSSALKKIAKNSNLAHLQFERGSHCALHLGVGWPQSSGLLNGWFLRNSREFLWSPEGQGLLKERRVRIDITGDRFDFWNRPRPWPLDRWASFRWTSADWRGVDLVLSLHSDVLEASEPGGFQDKCERFRATEGPISCRTEHRLRIKWTELAGFGMAPEARNSDEINRRVRFLNTQTEVVDSSGRILIGEAFGSGPRERWPGLIRARSQFEK
jgi:pimeloyl-ACP methyl ester carboxylesterase